MIDVDTSMIEYLRRGMTDDERLVVQALAKEEILAKAAIEESGSGSGSEVASDEPFKLGLESEDDPPQANEVVDAEEISDFDPESDSTHHRSDDDL